MDASKAATAGNLLYNLWQSGRCITGLPQGLRPSTRADGYRIQSFFERRSAAPLFGWKVAATSAAGQAHIRVDAPLAGRILSERVIADGGECSLRGNRMRVAELEFAFRMRNDLAPRTSPYTRQEVIDCVASLHPAIEIPDSRFAPFEAAGAAQLIADNACAHDFVLGAASPLALDSLNLATHTVTGFIDDGAPISGSGARVLGDPLVALSWLVGELSAHGLTLRAGEIVTTGTCVVPMPIREGNHLRGDFGAVGEVSLTFVE